MQPQANFSAAAVFVQVVESGSIRAAASVLGMPKSNVSRRVAVLEEQLGTRLLERSTRRMRLTDVGRDYYRQAALAVATLLEAERSTRDAQSAPRGVLRVTAPVNFGVLFLPGIAADFMLSHPEVELVLELTDRFVDLIDEGFDVAIRAGPVGSGPLVAHRLAGTALVTVAHPDYLTAHGIPAVPADLIHHRCLVHGQVREALWAFRSGRTTVEVAVRGKLVCNSFFVLRDAAMRGLGIARVPSFFAAEALEAGTLVPVLEGFEPPESHLQLVHIEGRHLAAKVRVFLDFIREAFLRAPPWS